MSKVDSYEKKMAQLEKVMRELEKEELPLADMIKNYEDGVKLSEELLSILKEAEGKVQILNGDKEHTYEYDN